METNIRKLESELKEEKNKNNDLLNENKMLKNENSQLKNNLLNNIQNINSNILKENSQLKELIIKSYNQIINSINDNKNFDNNFSNAQNSSHDSIYKLIKDKENIINDLNEKLKRFPFILEKNEKLMSIIFSSFDEKINYSLICKNTDNIHKLEGELYKEFPNLFEGQKYLFFYKGKSINKYQTFESNHIKNGDIIILK